LPDIERVRVWVLHKPKGVITTHKDPQNRPTLFSLLPKDMPRVISIGRLDFNTEGLIILTNNGELARHLELPATGWIRKYRVRAYGQPNPRRLREIEQGVTIEGITYAPAKIVMETSKKETGNNIWLEVSVKEGKNREVRKLLEHTGVTVNRLIRTAYGPFSLHDLQAGEYQEVPKRILDNFLGNWQKKP
jgi:23S rRNA pseudouridine2605 synthase